MTIKPHASELAPVNWSAIEPHYRAGVRSIRSIGREFGVSHTAVQLHANKVGWKRDLAQRVHRRVQEKLAPPLAMTRLPAALAGTPEAGANADQAIVESESDNVAHASARMGLSVRNVRFHGDRLLAALNALEDVEVIVHRAWEVLDELADRPVGVADRDLLRLALDAIGSFPERVKVYKHLVDATARAISLEREHFGMNTSEGTAGSRFLVVIKDYTGRTYEPVLEEP